MEVRFQNANYVSTLFKNFVAHFSSIRFSLLLKSNRLTTCCPPNHICSHFLAFVLILSPACFSIPLSGPTWPTQDWYSVPQGCAGQYPVLTGWCLCWTSYSTFHCYPCTHPSRCSSVSWEPFLVPSSVFSDLIFIWIHGTHGFIPLISQSLQTFLGHLTYNCLHFI